MDDYGLGRKGFISDDGNLTIAGFELLSYLEGKDTGKRLPKAKKTETPTDFDEWWEAYPTTDKFTFEGQSFSGHRALRINQVKCRSEFERILGEGKYTARQLIDAMKYDVLHKKIASAKTKSNKLTFMHASSSYLHQNIYEPFIQFVKDGFEEPKESKKKGATDI